MRIITDFKDYYDHIAYQYGGGDPKIVYIRPHIHNKNIGFLGNLDIKSEYFYRENKYRISIDGVECSESIGQAFSLYSKFYDGRNVYNPQVRIIIVGDIIFTQIKMTEKENYRMITEDDIKSSKHTWGRTRRNLKEMVNYSDPKFVDLCRHFGLPVFMFNLEKNNVYLDENCPNLGKLGIPKYIPDFMMYQHLSYFVGNVIKESPDMMPPVKVTDKDKILGHGFDVRTSFRGK